MEFTCGEWVRQGFGFANPNHAAAFARALLPFCWGGRGAAGSDASSPLRSLPRSSSRSPARGGRPRALVGLRLFAANPDGVGLEVDFGDGFMVEYAA